MSHAYYFWCDSYFSIEITMAKPRFTIEEGLILRQRYESGETTVSLAAEFNVSDSCISSWIKKVGGKLRTNSESKRKSTFNESYWDIIDTEQKAYWLGFFMADGYISQYNKIWRNLWCTLSHKDGHHLEQFLKDIGSVGYKVTYYKRKSKKTGNIHHKCRICLTSIPLVTNLCKLGWLEFKTTGDLTILNSVPDHLIHHLVRGFFDGDGSIGRQKKKRKRLALSYSVTIVAQLTHKLFLTKIRDIICDGTLVSRKSLKQSKSVWRCHWNGNSQIRRIGSWMYKDSTRWLERKKVRFDSIDRLVKFWWPADNHFHCSHTPKQISILDPLEKQLTIENFIHFVMNTKWVPLSYSDDQMKNDYQHILSFNDDLYIIMDAQQLIGFRLNVGGNKESPGKKIVLNFQKHFWNTDTTSPCIPDRWHYMPIVSKAANALLTTGTKITLTRYLREMRYAGAGVTSHFHPNFARCIIKALAPNTKSWFDPCMGWGGRLIAAKTLGIMYEGCDPQPDTFAGLLNIKKFISSEAIIHNIKAQDFKFDKRYDLGFTSPPFYNKERYGGSEQSYSEFPQFDLWFKQFLCPLVDKLKSNCDIVILHTDLRMAVELKKYYVFNEYPVYLQRNAGGPQGKEFILVFN